MIFPNPGVPFDAFPLCGSQPDFELSLAGTRLTDKHLVGSHGLIEKDILLSVLIFKKLQG